MIPALQVGDAVTDFLDHACHPVPEHHRQRSRAGLMRAISSLRLAAAFSDRRTQGSGSAGQAKVGAMPVEHRQ